MKRTMVLAVACVSLLLSAALSTAVRADDPVVVAQALDRSHVEFVIAHHLSVEIDLARATHETVYNAQGEPISLIFDADGISAFFTTQDGSIVHTLFKAHRAWLGLPEGVELAFSLSAGGSALVDFHRIYGVLELGTLTADLKTAAQDLQSPEWRETVLSLGKMLACAQLEKLPTLKGVPHFVVNWVTSAMKPVCSE